MPTIFFYGPELEEEKRKELVKAFTEVASRLTGIAPSAFVVYLIPIPQDRVGVGGRLLKDMVQEKGG